MTPYWTDGQVTLHHGDALDVLRGMPDNTVDAVVTDPPAGIAFMGREWDHHKGGRDQWIKWLAEIMGEALRVTKPGGHAFVWALPRTTHWTATALEDAGWVIRERVVHLFGSGFPKSLDVGKAIDRAAGAEREVVGKKGGRYASGYTPQSLATTPGGFYRWGDEHFQWDDLPENARAYFLGVMATKGDITAPATDDARTWDGWGTALKPAAEDWWLARKPLSEPTVAANVLRWGVGAINVDACRVEGPPSVGGSARGSYLGLMNDDGWQPKPGEIDRSGKRWPPNVLLGPDAAAELDRQSGTVPASARTAGREYVINNEIFSPLGTVAEGKSWGYPDSGGASRFFKIVQPDVPGFIYQAKAPTAERPRVKQDGAGDGRTTFTGKVCTCSTCGKRFPSPAEMTCGHVGHTYEPILAQAEHVSHPTVKPLDLMRYLVRLVTPPGGTILDPFAGSGTTGEAAILEHFHAILIEREADYLPLIVARLTKPIAVGFDFGEPA